MSADTDAEAALNNLKAIKRRPVTLTQETMIKTGYVNAERKFPFIVEPNVESLNLASWAESNLSFIEESLLKHGAILFRGFNSYSVSQFEAFAKKIAPELLDYNERAAPRKEVSANIYTSTEYPAEQYIPLHHEMSYSHNWPTKIWFFCLDPGRQGGRTPVANDREVFKLIPERIRNTFIEKKVMYVRNYGEGVDLSWQEVFQTDDKAVVEAYCRKARVHFEWVGRDRLRTRAVRQAIAVHPKTGDVVWFNHSHMFHVSNLDTAVREALLSEFNQEDLPRNAFYGDGSPIENSVLDEVRSIYKQSAVSFSWQRGDILMLDNFLASHGREPYLGPRRILVAMAELFTNTEF